MLKEFVSGGIVTAYVWDMEGGGFPHAALHDEMRGLGVVVPTPRHERFRSEREMEITYGVGWWQKGTVRACGLRGSVARVGDS